MKYRLFCFSLLLVEGLINSIMFAGTQKPPEKELIKQQLEYCPPGDDGMCQSWNFSLAKSVVPKYIVSCFLSNPTGDSLYCEEHNSRYYYTQKNDTLYRIGYEDIYMNMQYDHPLLVCCRKMMFGDSISQIFAGEGLYGELIPMRICGQAILKADGEGELTLPEITYDRTLRVHSLYLYEQSGLDSSRLVEERFSWYVPSCEIPVFETILAISYPIDSLGVECPDTIVKTSFAYQADIQDISYNNTSSDADNGSSCIADIYANAHYLPNPVETDLNISYTLMRDASIGYCVHSPLGVPILQVQSRLQKAGSHIETLSLAGLQRGNYTLFVYVDNAVIREVIIKK